VAVSTPVDTTTHPVRELGPEPALDGLRGAAILAVLATHVSFLDEGSYRFALRGGFLGVDLFIVLSAFLISSVLLRSTADGARLDGGVFAGRRLRRLVPPLAVFLVIESAVALSFGASAREQLLQAVLALTFTGNWQYALGHQPPYALVHLWSLAVEAQFYVLMALGVVFLRRRLRRPWVAVAGLVAGALLVACWRAWLFHRGVAMQALYVRTDTRADSMLLGVAAAVMWRCRLVPDAAIRVAGAVSAAVLLVCACTVSVTDAWLYRLGFTAIAGVSALLVAAVATGAGGLWRGTSWSPLRWVGARSYSLYLWHLPTYMLIVAVMPGAPIGLKVVLALIGSVSAAVLSFRFIETRALAAWRRDE